MIVESIAVRNFLSHADSRVDFADAPLWLICGENGSGKSALFDALEYALYGRHRAGAQHTALLVKQGQTRAQVEVVIRLGDARYRISHTIEAKGGNRGGRVDRWAEEVGCWQSVNVGSGVQDAWKWLKDRLPREDLFRSAVLLRQNETACFLEGTARDRIERYAKLVDLSAYSNLSTRARARAGTAAARQIELKARLADLGDLSNAALTALEATRDAAAARLAEATRALACAAACLSGAREWARLRAEAESLRDERDHLLGLLAAEAAIREDAAYVARWDFAQPYFSAVLNARARADRCRDEAEAARKRWTDAGTALDQHRQDLEARRRDRERAEAELTAARGEVEALTGRVRWLTDERGIAEARAKLAQAEAEVDRLVPAEAALQEWRRRWETLPLLEALAAARVEYERAQTAHAGAAAALRAAESGLEQATVAGEAAEARLAERAAELERLAAAFAATDAAVRTAEARVAARQGLHGDEAECPVCGRPLDATLHRQLHAALRSAERELERLRCERATIQTDHDRAEAAWGEAEAALSQARAAEARAEGTAEAARERLVRAAEELAERREAVDGALAALLAARPDLADLAARVSRDYLREWRPRLERGLRAAEAAAGRLEKARHAVAAARASLATLCARRPANAEPLGDRLSPEELSSELTTAEAARREAEATVAERERARAALDQAIVQLEKAISETQADIRHAEEAIARANRDLEHALADEQAVLAQLGPEWASVIVTDQAYARAAAAVVARRENARRLPELEQARGQLSRVERQLEANARAQAALDPAHDVAVETAEADERAAQEQRDRAVTEHGTAQQSLADFERRRATARELEAELEQTAQAVQTYAELAEILADNGPLQREVAQREQQRIMREVNHVLELLGDPLRVVLGDARRSRGELQDLQIVDCSDPARGQRYFEFLSGGEQFRIALAHALALHRRVGRGAAGTIIVDEGFGALDGDWRDTLARHLTDTGRGILNLKLAHTIVICSHSAEVQRHFPDRWLVRKRGGTAWVERPDPATD